MPNEDARLTDEEIADIREKAEMRGNMNYPAMVLRLLAERANAKEITRIAIIAYKQKVETAEARAAELEAGREDIRVIFDGPPSHESGRFVEVENNRGESINAGEWVDLKNGLWALEIPGAKTSTALLAKAARDATELALGEAFLQGYMSAEDVASLELDEHMTAKTSVGKALAKAGEEGRREGWGTAQDAALQVCPLICTDAIRALTYPEPATAATITPFQEDDIYNMDDPQPDEPETNE